MRNTIIEREQIAHLEAEKANIEAIRDRTISDAQRAAQAADYSGAGYRDLPSLLKNIRGGIEDIFCDLLAPVERRLNDLNESHREGSMTTLYTYHEPVYIEVRDGSYIEATAEITYRVVWPYPASYGQPAEDASTDIQSVRLLHGDEVLDLPAWMSDLITQSDMMDQVLLDHAFKEREAARDDAADHKRQTMMEAAE